MRLTVLTAALAAALTGFASAQAAVLDTAQLNSLAAQKTAQAAALGFDQVSLDANGRLNAMLAPVSQHAGTRAAAQNALRASGSRDVAAMFAGELASVVGLLPGSEMRVDDVKVLADGISYYHLTQHYQGLRVVGDDITVQIGTDASVQAVFGAAIAVESLRTRPTTDAARSIRSAAIDAMVRDGFQRNDMARNGLVMEKAPVLVVYAGNRSTPTLAWEATVSAQSGSGEPFRATVYADAHSGALLNSYTLIHRALNRRIYDVNSACINPSSPTGTLVLSEGGSTSGVVQSAVNAYNAFGNVYHFFRNNFALDSFNGTGGTLTGYVRAKFSGDGCSGANAYWASGRMISGIGSAAINDLTSEPDVTYHEFGHGVTDATSALRYQYESGGLNEASSDIYAAMVEAWINTVPGAAATAATPIAFNPDANTWIIGEGLSTDGSVFRSMRTPAAAPPNGDNSLDRYSQYVSRFGNCTNPTQGGNDYCGVHSSSGIANLAFYLLVNGGRHPANATNVVVEAIPFARAAQYFYEVHSSRSVTTSATFSQFRNAMQARARANANGGLCDEVRIAQAWSAVEVTGVAPQNPNACGGGTVNQAPTAAFTATPNGLTVAFNGSGSSDADGSIASYSWRFGDGGQATGASASRTYASAGTYTVELTVTDNQGATNTRTQQVTVTAANSQCPGAAFSGNFSGANGQNQYQPTGGSYTTTTSGTHTVCLSGPSANDYDVYLQRRSSSGTWSDVASGLTSSASERITYSGAAGTYRGTGAYTGTLQKP